MPRCAVCLQKRVSLKFRTGRLSICRYCVTSLNSTHLSAREAEAKWLEDFRAWLFRTRSDASTWADRWLSNHGHHILGEKLTDPESVRRSPLLKLIRAHRGGLICYDRRYLDYPAHWALKRYRVKDWHDCACCLCHARQQDGACIHVHHIVHRSHSGTNGDRNLVALCHRCHQRQHPGFTISTHGGEPAGPDVDSSTDETTAPEPEGALRLDFDEARYFELRPALEAAVRAFPTENGSLRELFGFLLRALGRNSGRYLLRFARDEGFRLDL